MRRAPGRKQGEFWLAALQLKGSPCAMQSGRLGGVGPDDRVGRAGEGRLARPRAAASPGGAVVAAAPTISCALERRRRRVAALVRASATNAQSFQLDRLARPCSFRTFLGVRQSGVGDEMASVRPDRHGETPWVVVVMRPAQRLARAAAHLRSASDRDPAGAVEFVQHDR